MDYEAEIKSLNEKIATLEAEIQELPDKAVDEVFRKLISAYGQNARYNLPV